ncbi:MAG: hypothetical protein ACFFD4_19175 [Candidatus Odinarchaeota archaeon]
MKDISRKAKITVETLFPELQVEILSEGGVSGIKDFIHGIIPDSEIHASPIHNNYPIRDLKLRVVSGGSFHDNLYLESLIQIDTLSSFEPFSVIIKKEGLINRFFDAEDVILDKKELDDQLHIKSSKVSSAFSILQANNYLITEKIALIPGLKTCKLDILGYEAYLKLVIKSTIADTNDFDKILAVNTAIVEAIPTIVSI